MKNILLLLIGITGQVFAQLQYPVAKKTNQTDVYFGQTVADPYRWLETDDVDTKQWIADENNVTHTYLNQIPFRDSVQNKLEKLWNFPRYRPSFKVGSAYFYLRNNGLQNQDVLYYKRGLDFVGMLFLDPNTVDTTGLTSLSGFSGNKNGAFIAFNVSRAGSDWQQIRIKDIKKSRTLADSIDWVKFSQIAWKDSGFFYSRYDAPVDGDKFKAQNTNHKVYYHRVGLPQQTDLLVYSDPTKPKCTFRCQTSSDERYLIINGAESTSGNNIIIKDLSHSNSPFITIVSDFNHSYKVVDIINQKLIVQTNDEAKKGRLISIDINNIDKKNWTTIIPESADVMQEVHQADKNYLVKYMHMASNKILGYSNTGKFLYEVKLPGLCTVNEINSSVNDSVFFYNITSFTIPTTVYMGYAKNGRSMIDGYDPTKKIAFRKDDYITKQVTYKSKDGTEIPMFIVHKKNLQLNGNNPTLLHGYGGFNISKTPEFRAERLLFLEQGGIFAMPNLRGGGEFGDAWHKAGTKLNKQNVFDDFIAAAQYLIDSKYTSAEKLAINGGSNGGLLVGACITQRPDLFKVALPSVGV
ncbi:MAG TPA: prolyl oligopeptidase family serine peptidase, partial [Bacteroidia bacterium]|nr:prolyl oligopeptidase family serine peptidase [Bacteroidia bacterium]